MKIGVYVGSFNPVHKGHIFIINHLIKNKYVDKVIVIPTSDYWDKQDLIDINHRINMLKYYESENIIIDDKLNDEEFTYNILNKLKNKYINDELYLIIGADNIIKFHLWKNVYEILKYNVIVINRDNIDVYCYINNFKEKNKFIVVNNIDIAVSSSMIRNDIDKNNNMLDNNVYKYIKDNNLYRK